MAFAHPSPSRPAERYRLQRGGLLRPPRLLPRRARSLLRDQDHTEAEIDEEARATLHTDTSRPFEKPKSARIAVKVNNHLGDEVMKVFRVGYRIRMEFRSSATTVPSHSDSFRADASSLLTRWDPSHRGHDCAAPTSSSRQGAQHE